MLSERAFISTLYVALDASAAPAYCTLQYHSGPDPMRHILPILVFALLSACAAHLPAIDKTISAEAQKADYPTLQPLPELINRAEAGSTIEVQTEALAARVGRLKARAAALRGRSIIDGATRLKLVNATKDRPA